MNVLVGVFLGLRFIHFMRFKEHMVIISQDQTSDLYQKKWALLNPGSSPDKRSVSDDPIATSIKSKKSLNNQFYQFI